jgi:hypothetical protein
MIVFGINHFKIKSYDASEFGLIDPSWTNTRFEAVQRYFHVMYIPFFPVGKMIGTRGADGKLYHLDPRVAAHISTYQLKHRTPWYAFLLPILFGVGFIIMIINGMITDAKHQRYREKESAKYTANANAMIDHPSLYDYYQFAIDTTGGEDGYVSHQTFAVYRVVDFTDKAIQFRSGNEDIFGYLSNPEYEAWLNYLADSSGYKTFWISKADLRKTLIPAGKESYDVDGAKISIAGKPCYVLLEKAHVIDGPEFEAFYNSRSSKGEVSLRVDNIGDTAMDISFTKLTGEGKWTLEAEEMVLPSDFFYLKTEDGMQDNFSCKIDCKSPGGKPHSFIIATDPEEEYSLIVKRIK